MWRRALSRDRRDEQVFGVTILAAVAPIVVATFRALARGWRPVGDNGILVLRARDVLTEHHPLLGSWSSSSTLIGDSDFHINNPGPLYSDLIALPSKLLGPTVGLAVGVMLINAAMVVLAVIVARRSGGVGGAVMVGLATAVLGFVMGSELLFDVWQPNALILIYFAFLVLCWATSTGDLIMIPWMVGVGSLLVQTHLSYIYLVTLITALAATLAGVAARRRRQPVRRPLLATGAVVVVAWIQPVVDQFNGERNLTSLLTAASKDAPRVGAALGTRITGDALVLSQWWTRRSFLNGIPLSEVVGEGNNVPVASLAVAVVALVAVTTLLVGVTACRRFPDALRRMAVIAVGAVLGCWWTSMAMPVSAFGITPHQFRWIWPTAAFVTAAFGWAAFSLVRWTSVRLAVPVALLVTVAILNLPYHATPSGPTADRRFQSSVSELVDQLGVLEGRGVVAFDTRTLVFAEPYSGPLMAELQRRGIPFVVTDAAHTRQVGGSRRFDEEPPNADLRIWLDMGPPDAYDDPSIEAVAWVHPFSADDRRQLLSLEGQLREYFRSNGVTLSSAGRDAVRGQRLHHAETELNDMEDPFAALDARTAALEGWLQLPPGVERQLETYVDLYEQRNYATITLYAGPVDVTP